MPVIDDVVMELPGAGARDSFETDVSVCFELLLFLSGRLAKLPAGAPLEFISRDPQAHERIVAWCEERGYTLHEARLLPDGRQRFVISR